MIQAGTYGVRTNGAAGTVANAGQITAGADGVSPRRNHGGTVTNSGAIFGAHMGGTPVTGWEWCR